MMVICKEDNSEYNSGGIGAIFICECSMGEPYNEFGKWFAGRFCGAPSLLDQLHGLKQHYYTKVTEVDVFVIEEALKTMENTADNNLLEYIKKHVNMHISTENW